MSIGVVTPNEMNSEQVGTDHQSGKADPLSGSTVVSSSACAGRRSIALKLVVNTLLTVACAVSYDKPLPGIVPLEVIIYDYSGTSIIWTPYGPYQSVPTI